MKKETVKNKLAKFSDLLENKKAEINIMLVDQKNQRKKPYKGFMLKTKLEDVYETISTSFLFLNEEIDKRTLDVYDLVISIDDSVQMVKKEDVINGAEILDELTTNYTEENVVNKSTDLSKIKFIVIQVYDSEEDSSIYFFKKYAQPSTAYKTSQKYILSGGLLKQFTDEIITINSYVDAFLIDEDYYIFNRNAFNAIFNYKDIFKRILDDNCGMIRKSGLMTDSDQFVADCEADGRYLTRLTKAILAKGFEEVTKNKGDIPSVVKEFELSLKTSKNGEIVYRGKDDIPEILNLLLRHYVIDALTSNKMIAAAIQEYQAGK